MREGSNDAKAYLNKGRIGSGSSETDLLAKTQNGASVPEPAHLAAQLSCASHHEKHYDKRRTSLLDLVSPVKPLHLDDQSSKPSLLMHSAAHYMVSACRPASCMMIFKNKRSAFSKFCETCHLSLPSTNSLFLPFADPQSLDSELDQTHPFSPSRQHVEVYTARKPLPSWVYLPCGDHQTSQTVMEATCLPKHN